MGTWLFEIFGSDEALDSLAAIEREVMSGHRLEPFDWDEVTRERLVSRADTLQNWALHRAIIQEATAENATALAFLIFGLALGCEPTNEMRDRAQMWMADHLDDIRSELTPSQLQTLTTLSGVTALLPSVARTLIGDLWCARGVKQAVSAAYLALGIVQDPHSVEGYVDTLMLDQSSASLRYTSIRETALSYCEAWDADHNIDVLTVGAILTSIGIPLQREFIRALEIAVARDTHPASSAPERALIMEDLLRASRSQGVILPSFTNLGLGAAFQRAADAGEQLVNITSKETKSH